MTAARVDNSRQRHQASETTGQTQATVTARDHRSEETTGLIGEPRTGADQRRCVGDPAERTELRLWRRNRSGTGNQPNVQVNWDSVTRPNRRKRNKRVRLWGRLPGRPASPADPSPPSRMHRQRDLGMRGASLVLRARSSGAHGPLRWWVAGPRPTWGEHGFRSTRNGRRRGTGRKKFIELVTDQMILNELFSNPRRRTGRVLAATHQRNRPVRVLVQVSKTRRAKREVDPCKRPRRYLAGARGSVARDP
jgi:hypothetical protein